MHRLHGTLSETVLYSIPMSLSLRRDTVNENVTALAKITPKSTFLCPYQKNVV